MDGLPSLPVTTPINQGSSLAPFTNENPDQGLFTTYWIQWLQALVRIVNIIAPWINSNGTIDGVAVEDPAWTSYTPTVTVAPSGTFSTTTLDAAYMAHGKSITVRIEWSGDFLSGAPEGIMFSLPVGLDPLLIQACCSHVSEAGTNRASTAVVRNTFNDLLVICLSGAYPLVSHVIRGQATYEAA